MPSDRTVSVLVLSAAAVLVAALVGVLWIQLQPSGGKDGGPGRIVDRASGGQGEPELPTPIDRQVPQPPSAVVLPVEAPVQHLGPDMIIGRVIDRETGEAVPAFEVHVLPWADSPPLSRLDDDSERRPYPMRTRSGIFKLQQKPGRYDVVIRATTFLPGVMPDVEVPRENALPTEIFLEHGPGILGTVRDHRGYVASQVPVFLSVDRMHDGAKPPNISLATTDEYGRFRFSPLPPGDYTVSALEPDNSYDRLARLRVDQGTNEVDLMLGARHQLVIVVRDRYGRPVRDARVELRGTGSVASSKTLPSGQAILRHLREGDYRLSIQRDGYLGIDEPLTLDGYTGEQVKWFTLEAGVGG